MTKEKADIKVWVVDDDSSIRWVLERVLIKAGIQVTLFSNAIDVLDHIKTDQPDVMLTDIRMPGMDGLTLLEHVHQQHPSLPIIVITAHSDLESTVSSYEKGAFEYLSKPFDIDETLSVVKKAAESRQNQTSEQPNELSSTTGIIGKSSAMQDVFRIIGRLVNSSINVLITGESGTGKELVANALHQHSPRSKQNFIAINTAAIPKELLESELFGHEKGAFTGAHSKRQGHFELANNGTLFLDEIGDMPADMQTRLLRVLAEGEFYRVGGHQPIKVDVRVIAATHQNLEAHVEQGKFREDLYHRLNVINVKLPALRERRDDIPLLLNHFMNKLSAEQNQSAKNLSDEVMDFLCQHHWPGNIRQLENTCRWLTVMATGDNISLDDLPNALQEENTIPQQQAWDQQLRQYAHSLCLKGETNLLNQLQPVFERTLLEIALEHTSGKKIEAAQLLGWGRNTLTRKLKDLEMTHYQ